MDGPGPGPDDVLAGTHLVDLGVTRLSWVRCGSFEERRAQRWNRPADPGMYQLSLTIPGWSGTPRQRREADPGSAELTLYDTARSLHAWTPVTGPEMFIPGGRPESPADDLVLLFPREALPIPGAEVERLLGTRLPAGEGVGALLSGLMLQLARQRDSFPPQEATRISMVLLDLLATLLTQVLGTGSAASPNDSRGLMVMRVQAFIELNLGDADLSPSMIASAHHISTRHLQRLFEEQELSVARWIRHRQLERCRHDLADPGQDALPVRVIAARWGFGSESHFNRAFRAAYGIPPAAYRRGLRASADTATARWPLPLRRRVRADLSRLSPGRQR
ncbi:helix-turn-helix domain-containing protein [Streptosporangium sp. V21-05]|uniref:helix-turn-helix domain-containing protein n=1 Tax=Streptosporangium sp. V21-05 TaxID=3446115 RepID=UPI003F535D85